MMSRLAWPKINVDWASDIGNVHQRTAPAERRQTHSSIFQRRSLIGYTGAHIRKPTGEQVGLNGLGRERQSTLTVAQKERERRVQPSLDALDCSARLKAACS